MRIPSAATASTQTPQPPVSILQAGAGFAELLSAASVIRFPVQPGSAPKEQSGQGSSNKAAARPTEAQAVSVQSNENSCPIVFPSRDDRNESVARETADDQDKSNRKTNHSVSSQSSINHADDTPDNTTQLPQIAEANALSADQLPRQGSDQTQSEENLTANEKQTNAQDSKVGFEVCGPEQLQPGTNEKTPESSKFSQDPSTSFMPLNTVDEDDSDASAEPVGLQSLTTGTIPSSGASIPSQPLSFAMSTTPDDKQIGIGVAGNTTQKIEITKTNSGNQDTANAAGPAAGKTDPCTNSVSETPTHSAQGTANDSLQISATTQRVADIVSSHPNSQTALNTPVSSPATTAPRIADGPGEISHSGALRSAAPSIEADTNPAMPASAMSDARLMQTMNQSEMRIGLNSNAFGEISIRTSISGHELIAQISLDHSELSQAMSAQVSSVQTKLGDELGLQTLIEINNHATAQPGDAGSSSQRERGSPAAPARASSVAAVGEEGSGSSQEAVMNKADETRLDIRA